jgi:hypothetical protein
MLRRSASVVLVFAVIAAGCSKKDEATGAGGAGGAGGGGAGGAGGSAVPAKAAGGKAVEWAKVERVPFAKLQTTMPDPILPGFKRTEQGGSVVPDGESTYSEANATYHGPNDASIHVVVQDHPIASRDLLPNKTTAFKGFPVVHEHETSDDSEFRIIVADRFIVFVQGGGKVKVAQLKAAVEKLDLVKLASWKNEGIK